MKKLLLSVICLFIICLSVGCSNNKTPVGKWYNEEGTILTIKKDGDCEVSFAGKDKEKYEKKDIISCSWKTDFEHEYRATVSIGISPTDNPSIDYFETLINDMSFITSNGTYVTWGGFKRK